jgi:hypothetical protein
MTAVSLDAMMSPLADCLDAASLRALADFRAPADAAARVSWLAERVNEGILTAEERAEYESAVTFANFVGILQSKARRKLSAAG